MPKAPREFRLFLQEELLRRCKKNPAYSVRAFAKALQVDYSTLAKILKGQRPLGERAIRKMAARLGLGPADIAGFIPTRAAGATNGTDAVAGDYQQLALDSFQIISDWYHYAILELMRVDSFKSDPKWVAKALGITQGEVNIAVERLKRVGLLEVDADGKWSDVSGGKSTTLGNEFTTGAFRNLQRQVLEKALTALEQVPMDRRDQTSMTMAIDTIRIPVAKQKIKQFRRSLAKFLSRGESRDEVYNLSISLYPISQIKEKRSQS